MFFVLSKTLGILFEPMNFLIFAGLFGLVLCPTRFARAGRIIVVAVALVFVIIGFSPLASLVIRPLENRFPQPPAGMPPPAGIIVLGGSINQDISAVRGQPTLTEAASRLTAGVALSRLYPNARLVFTGGASDLRGKALDEASGVRDLWRSLGVPDERMTFENQSRNTFENAAMTMALVKPNPSERWLLVTSAWHMPRSMGIFRRVGWPVVAYPVDYRTFGDDRDFRLSSTAVDSFRKLDTAMHEWVGLVAYRLTNKTNALFPAP